MKVLLTTDAEKHFIKLSGPERSKIEKKLFLLKENPLAGKKLAGKYADEYSLRAWPYRIIYIVNKRKEEVVILTIIHRQGAYK